VSLQTFFDIVRRSNVSPPSSLTKEHIDVELLHACHGYLQKNRPNS
jgi:hypothetical protein